MIEKIMWYFNCTREEAEVLYENLSDSMKNEIDISYYAWMHDIDW